MATYTRIERTTVTIEWRVPAGRPWGACWAEVMKAIRAAHNELSELDPKRYPPGKDVPDDAIRLLPLDEDVVVMIELDDRLMERRDARRRTLDEGGL
jgi:hypothetical protein